jgi:hypothetical protein
MRQRQGQAAEMRESPKDINEFQGPKDAASSPCCVVLASEREIAPFAEQFAVVGANSPGCQFKGSGIPPEIPPRGYRYPG